MKRKANCNLFANLVKQNMFSLLSKCGFFFSRFIINMSNCVCENVFQLAVNQHILVLSYIIVKSNNYGHCQKERKKKFAAVKVELAH